MNAKVRIVSQLKIGNMTKQQERTGSLTRPWLSRETGPISSGVPRNSGPLHTIHYPSRSLPPRQTVPGPSPLSQSLLPSSLLCDFFPRSLLSPPTLSVPANAANRLTYTSTFDVAAHLDGGPTGPPGKCQAASQTDPDSLPYLTIMTW